MNTKIKNLIFREKRKNPYLGVRGLAAVLRSRHKIILSKSAIHNILKNNGIQDKLGRKKCVLLYKTGEIEHCGLFLLRCLDFTIGFFDLCLDSFSHDFAQINGKLLKNILMICSFSAVSGNSVFTNLRQKGFLRIFGLRHLSAAKIKQFITDLEKYSPLVNLEKLENNLTPISTIKFCFENGYTAYCDGKLSTFWDAPCHIKDFFTTAQEAIFLVDKIIQEKTIIISYTKSFDYLSPLVISFINALSSGIKRIEVIDDSGKIIASRQISGRFDLAIGYYPRILSKGAVFLEKIKKSKRLGFCLGDISYTQVLTRFLSPKDSKGAILNSILINKRVRTMPCWGIITNKKDNLETLLKRYLLFWPYLDTAFSQEMEIIDKFFSRQDRKKDLRELIPGHITLAKLEDLAQVSRLFCAILKEKGIDADFLNKSGRIIMSKDTYFVIIYGLSDKIKQIFNKHKFYLDTRRVFLG